MTGTIKLSQTRDNVFSNQSWGKYPDETLIRFIARNFYSSPDRSKVRILEIGCGPGANIWYLSREGFKVYGIDISKIAIKQSKRFLKSENLKAVLRVHTAKNLPYKDNYFDAVVDNACLCHNPKGDTLKIVAEVKRVLKPNGLFYSRTFTDKMSPSHLKGKGFVRFTKKDEINGIYRALEILSIDSRDYTQSGNTISEWIIHLKKSE